MKPWELLGSATAPSGESITLHRRDTEYRINVNGHLLMHNLAHASEDALAEIGLRGLGKVKAPSVLVGGLGMGYTLAAALRRLGPEATVFVAELLPAVVEWNRGPLAHLAGYPLRDPRVTVLEKDIAELMRSERGAYDAILQDVDNGPEGQTMASNDWLYGEAGLAAAAATLRPNGVLAFWSSKPNKEFVKRLRKVGFDVQEHPVRSRDAHRGSHYIIWTATRARF